MPFVQVDDAGSLSAITARVRRTGPRISKALEGEMNRQMELLADQVRGNIGAEFKNPSRMQAAVGVLVRRNRETIEGTVDASGAATGVVLPFVSLLESGGTTRPHVIHGRPLLAFFWEREGVPFGGPRVNHPGSRFEPRHFVRDAIAARRQAIVDAFRRVAVAAAG